MSQTRFYMAVNANRVIAGIVFTVTDIVASTAFGVYATEDPDLISKLDALTLDPKSAVTAISQEEYETELAAQKKMIGWPISSASSKPPEPTGPIKGQTAALVREDPPEEEPENPDKPIEVTSGVTSVEEAISTAKVEATPADPPTESKSKKKGKG